MKTLRKALSPELLFAAVAASAIAIWCGAVYQDAHRHDRTPQTQAEFHAEQSLNEYTQTVLGGDPGCMGIGDFGPSACP